MNGSDGNTTVTRAPSSIVFRSDLYPRFNPDQKLIERYAQSVEFLPPILINQADILIDGYHRLKAHQIAGARKITCQVRQTASEKELKRLAYQFNSHHGLQLSDDEKRAYANEMIAEVSASDLAAVLSVDERTISRWTKERRRSLEEERDRRIVELYLRAWNTQEAVAQAVDTTQRTVSNVVESRKNGQLSDFSKDFSPYLYTVWSTPKRDGERDLFGALPAVYMENLLHYHTQPLDIVYDPFAGSGTTVDVCKAMFRRYYCSDRKVLPGRESDIHEWNVKDGLPADLPKPDLAFLDPPYWKQAEGMYSTDAEDLGNMSLEDFNGAMAALLAVLVARGVPSIALVIQPTQYRNDWQWQDHIFDFHAMIGPAYRIAARYILPYTTQQYNAQQVEKAKEVNRCLCLHRDLVVWERVK